MATSSGPIASYFSLLETKLYCPQWSADRVSRPRLIDRLQPQRKLTLVSAPAGFGKTTLLAEWIVAVPKRAIAWVSLDASDNTPATFWAYVIAALQSIQPNLGERALSLVQSSQPPEIEAILMTLLNELTVIKADVALVLDVYHVIEIQAIHDGLGFLLSHLPPQVHMVIASRTDPPLTLARLRSHGDLTELRAIDLRFTPDEAATFLNQAMGLEISAADVAALEQRTEGWIAGLQLAALSLQGREDISDFVAAFSGDDRYIVDYLLEEVLQRQSDRENAVADQDAYRSLPAAIANTRAFHAQALGDFAGAITHAEQALALLPAEDDNERGVTAAFLLDKWRYRSGVSVIRCGVAAVSKDGQYSDCHLCHFSSCSNGVSSGVPASYDHSLSPSPTAGRSTARTDFAGNEGSISGTQRAALRTGAFGHGLSAAAKRRGTAGAGFDNRIRLFLLACEGTVDSG